jgi:hypothetical protein
MTILQTITSLLAALQGDSIFLAAVQGGLDQPEAVISMIAEQAQDNRGLVQKIIGDPLLKAIESYNKTKEIL